MDAEAVDAMTAMLSAFRDEVMVKLDAQDAEIQRLHDDLRTIGNRFAALEVAALRFSPDERSHFYGGVHVGA